MDTERAPILQIMLAQCKSDRHILMLRIARGNHILQIHPGGASAFPDKLQEAFKIALFQSRHLLGHSGILLIEVDTPHHRPVAAGLAQFRKSGIKFFLIHPAQNLLPKPGGNSLDLTGDRRVFLRQIRMVRAGIDDAQRVAAGGKIKGNGFDHRLILVVKIDIYQISHGRGHLIHQSAGFSEIHIFRILADHSYLRLGGSSIKEQMVDDRAHQHLKGRGRA